MGTRLRGRVGLLLVGVLALAGGWGHAAPRKGDPVADEVKRLEGTWRVIAIETGGQELGRDEFGPNNLVVISGTKFSVVTGRSKRTIECTFTIDPAKDPKWIDTTRTDDKASWPGIYELKGDTLKLYFGSPGKRPTELKTKAGDGQTIHTHERVKE
jgi:uncharacterized protein (TIGR03067 family)